MDLTARALGDYGERLACRYLLGQGLTILDRNWRCARGEIDIVALDGRCVVVCEVKTRTSEAFGAPFEAVTWTQLGVHKKPCGILNVAAFYDPIVQFLDSAVREQFIRPAHRETVLVDADPGRLLDKLAEVVLPDVPKWIGLAEA